MMTKKDFIRIAAEINAIADMDERKKAAGIFAAIAKTSNPRFDIYRFLNACGV